MERLTKKNNDMGSYTQFGDKYIPNHNIRHKQCVEKLGQLEDIEQELGIPLEVLFKALKDGFWCITKEDGIEFMYRPKLFYNQDSYYFREDIFWFEAIIKTKDYGKTWSFVQEELQNV